MNTVEEDTLVSCPIVCGEYMRATGFFYSTDGTTYLITARHNCLPTSGQKLKTGERTSHFETEDFLPTIDVYLRMSDGFEVERINLTEVSGLIQTQEFDVLAVPIDIEPSQYGYHIWGEDEIRTPRDAPETVTVVGFNRKSFPEHDQPYEIDIYRNQIGKPVLHLIMNDIDHETDLSRYGVMPVGIDSDSVGRSGQYDGLSGAPLLDDGLVGIHSNNVRLPERAFEITESE